MPPVIKGGLLSGAVSLSSRRGLGLGHGDNRLSVLLDVCRRLLSAIAIAFVFVVLFCFDYYTQYIVYNGTCTFAHV